MKKETITQRLQRLKHEDISKISDDELKDILRHSTRETRRRTTLLKKEGITTNKYARGDVKIRGINDIKTRKSLEAELRKQTEFLTDPTSTVAGAKHQREIKRLRLLQQTELMPKTSDYMEQMGYKGIKGLKRAEKELIEKSYAEHPEVTHSSLKEAFDMYDKIKELDPSLNKDTIGSDRLIREIKQISTFDKQSIGDDFADYLKKEFPNLTNREIKEILRNDIYTQNKVMGVLYASLKSAYKDALDSYEDI